MVKKIFVGACIILAVYGVASIILSNIVPLDRVTIAIKAEFQQEFIEGQFTEDDFEWSNVKNLYYGMIIYDLEDNPLNTTMEMEIQLKRSGLIQVLIAMLRFKTLEFVENVRFADQTSISF
jgi:hypothetical protein